MAGASWGAVGTGGSAGQAPPPHASPDVWTNWTSFGAGANVTTFTDRGVTAGTFAYLVRSRNLLGASEWTIAVLVVDAAGP